MSKNGCRKVFPSCYHTHSAVITYSKMVDIKTAASISVAKNPFLVGKRPEIIWELALKSLTHTSKQAYIHSLIRGTLSIDDQSHDWKTIIIRRKKSEISEKPIFFLRLCLFFLLSNVKMASQSGLWLHITTFTLLYICSLVSKYSSSYPSAHFSSVESFFMREKCVPLLHQERKKRKKEKGLL